MSSALEVLCLYCGSQPGQKCRSLKTKRVTDTHALRWETRYPPVGAHACREFDPACWRCDLAADETTDRPSAKEQP